ncbi:hypothetical protein MJO28_013597 [Puccinia striiformis f. sp. tritici]|uniref:3-beta hydroxysteroid dehydrogenase/isomerase domain-containing protein n=2 Tax=Puccinia striiformis TaxID=27350 RepID=A0A2S4VY24_9BASI|nr:hypothetical protein Pst134EB_026451 [Puccinia striiformis f. sp. tritici]KAI7939945.1 hypothetical protein MJO28_013597 [Puccinia striiformis f. sp. tritici]KAI9629147.1 hypothetical protein KEM48_010993 [Puccinia striiformis f. sp. tritici PST-130]POW14434.1 hypothetical protein PSTT_02954 [Puccinia striiformis]
MSQTFEPKNILVIGGEGFLGHNLVETLKRTYPESAINSLDLIQRFFEEDNKFIQADLTSPDSLLQAFSTLKPELVFHTASPWTGSSKEICENVNVKGTSNTILACQKFDVQRLVYTSSAGVVFNGNDLINVDERLPIPKIGCDHYNTTKARAEAIVLEANGKEGLLTCAIRPAGIFGPGDRQAIPGMIDVLKSRKHGIQIGSNRNLFDWTYVDNVVEAHILAASKLDQVIGIDEFSNSLKPIQKTIERRNLLTSGTKEEEGDGSSLDEVSIIDLSTSGSNQSDQSSAYNPTNWIQSDQHLIDKPIPAKRHRWDQWAPISTQINHPTDQISVAGQAYFITNGEPIFFWDFARSIWFEYHSRSNQAKKSNLNPIPKFTIILPTFLALLLATISQFLVAKSLFTPEKVRYTSASKYHNIEKARVILGYEPIIGVQEGIQKAVQWYIDNEDHHLVSDKKND